MRKLGTVVVAVALVAAGFAAGRFHAGHGEGPVAAGGRKVLHYACPMHPTVKADAPGTAPCCGMALEPVYADGGAARSAAPGAVTISPELRQLQGVRVGVAEQAAGKQTVRLYGRVVPQDNRVYVIQPTTEGTVRDVGPAAVGSVVRKGEILGTYFSPDARPMLQSYLTALEAQAMNEASRREAGLVTSIGVTPDSSTQFAAERLRALGVSQEQVDEMYRTRILPVTIQLRAPTSGVVIARDFSAGRMMGPGMECFRIANVDKVWILADLPGADASLVRPGAKARVTLPGGGVALAATVGDAPPQFDAQSQTLKVRLEAQNPGMALRPDMFVDVEVDVERGEAVTVPSDAIVDAGTRRTVFVETAAGAFEPREVETGWRAGGRVEIVRGLAAGERIVVAGTFMVDSESQLRSAAAGPAPAPAAPAAAATGAVAANVDPICGMTVDPEKARAAGRTHAHGGRTWVFCSDQCKATFAADPERHAHADAHVDAGHGKGAL